MKLSESKLRSIIREELSFLLTEKKIQPGQEVRINADEPPISSFNGKEGEVSDMYSQIRDIKVTIPGQYKPLDVYKNQVEVV